MNKGLAIVKNEFLELLPPTIFFFIAIGLLMLTKHLVLKQYDIHVSDFAAVVVGALIIGKVVLIADHFSFVDKYPGKPLIYNVLWKTGIYFIAACIVRIAEEIVPKVFNSGNFAVTSGRRSTRSSGRTSGSSISGLASCCSSIARCEN